MALLDHWTAVAKAGVANDPEVARSVDEKMEEAALEQARFDENASQEEGANRNTQRNEGEAWESKGREEGGVTST